MKAIISILTFFPILSFCQNHDSTKVNNWSNHFQLTVIAQKHLKFPSKYSGGNSLADSVEPAAKSTTATLFFGRKLWRGGAFYFNPEVSGGNGLSFAKGVAGALNGETYRVGAVEPAVSISRAYFQQHIPLGTTAYEEVKNDVNQVTENIPSSRITISAGKFAISDFYDNNKYSKDPRSQFFNWAIWANGAWDYPANTRGYTFGLVTELIKPNWALRLSSVAVPRIANFHLMEYKFSKAHSETFEFEHKYLILKKPGIARLTLNNTYSKAPSYREGLKAIVTNDSIILNVIQGNLENKNYGGRKYGIGFNIEQAFSKDAGFFTRIGWNDGNYASWAFTEIDQSVCFGLSLKGAKWKRPDDTYGFAVAINGISRIHRDFLNTGGYGFIIGDGKLTYGNETILETYYNAKLSPFFWITADYQFVNHPAYNKDRGPVHVFAIRGHIEI